MTVKSEWTYFTENGVVCKAYVTAVIDTESMENKLLDVIKKINRADDTKEIYVPRDLTDAMSELEVARDKMVEDLSKATAYTAGSECKLQEVTGIKDDNFQNEKGEISAYLKENFEMNKNYRYAELTPFVEIVGAEKIIRVLDDINKKKILDAKDTMTFAKIERTKAKSYGNIVLEEAAQLFSRAGDLMFDANDEQMSRLKVIRREADDAIKLIRALEVRNKNVDEVAKKYEKANKIATKNNKGNPPLKTSQKIQAFLDNLFKDLWTGERSVSLDR